MKSKILKNHKLINYLADHRKITLVSVNKTHVICTLSDSFTPDDVNPLCDAVGQFPMPRKRTEGNYIIFERFPKDGNGQ